MTALRRMLIAIHLHWHRDGIATRRGRSAPSSPPPLAGEGQGGGHASKFAQAFLCPPPPPPPPHGVRGRGPVRPFLRPPRPTAIVGRTPARCRAQARRR